jgi:hypothetical protein
MATDSKSCAAENCDREPPNEENYCRTHQAKNQRSKLKRLKDAGNVGALVVGTLIFGKRVKDFFS